MADKHSGRRTVQQGGGGWRGRRSDLLLSTEFGLVEFSRDWPASSILRLTLSTCQGTEREYMLRYDSNARGIRPSISLSFWKHHVFHHQTSLVDCDSYEALHRPMNSITCWNMPLVASRKTCVHYTARPLLCWCIQSSLWRVGSRRRWG